MLATFSLDTFWHRESLTEMFVVALPILEKMLRPIVIYFFLVISLRVFGKRELSNLNPFDFVVLLTLSNTVQNAIIGNDNSVSGGMIGALTLLATNYLVVRFIFKHRRLDQLVQGKPTVLIEHGKIRKEGLARELLNHTDLLSIAHRQGFANLSDVDHCELEPGGTFFVQGKTPATDELRHAELLGLLAEITKRIEAMGVHPSAKPETPGS